MKLKYSKNKKGFTLIELMIVLVIMGILTPAVYRFYHESFRSGHDNFTRASGTIRDTGIFFNYIAADLKSSTGLIASFDRFHTNQTTLIIKGIDMKSRSRYLAETGDMTFQYAAMKDECIIVYYLNDSHEVIREEYIGKTVLQGFEKTRDKTEKTVNMRYKAGARDEGVFTSSDYNQTALLGDIETLQFLYNSGDSEKSRRLDVQLARKTGDSEVWPVGSLWRTYHLSQ